jgi:2-hydroxychromene-2-carboxylate isomerase
MTESMRMTFYYDVVCPYAYLAAERIFRLPEGVRDRIDWRPVHLGGLLQTTKAETNPMRVMSPHRKRMNQIDLSRWAERLDLPLMMPDAHPMRTTDAMRHLTILPDEERARVSRAYFRAYWSSGSAAHWQKVEQAARGLLDEGGLIESSGGTLRTQTSRLVDLGGCGVPCFEVGEQLFWGQDRLFQAISALTKTAASQSIGLDAIKTKTAPVRVRFFHDFSSPFSYLASTQVEDLCRSYDVSLQMMPVLLGALFKNIGTANVPLFTFSEAKRAYLALDLERWASHWGVGFRFPSQFPMRTVNALRIALVKPALTQALYRWAWDEGVDLGDDLSLRQRLTDEVENVDALFEAAQEPSVKNQLRHNTAEADALGVCGVPTFAVDFHDETFLVWGQDRLCVLEWMLKGWQPPSEKEQHS